MPESNRGDASRFARLAPWLLIGGLVLFHAINNWLWLTENVTWTGWDQPRHLAWSLNYAHLLEKPAISSLFAVMTSDPIRPPFFAASASILYALFGRTADVAIMVNVIYLAVALMATYGIGRRWGGWRLGLVSVSLLALFPMFYSMSRHFYVEFALTAMVSLSVYLLLATEGFQRRGTSLLCGVVLGLGLLTKRTFPVFAAGPTLVIVLTSGLIPALWQRLKRRPRIHWKKALLALIGGLVLAAIWYLPNRGQAQGEATTLILGDLLFLLWWALAALAVYFLTLPADPLSNALSAFFLAAGLASTWYLAHIEFVQRVALYGYGIDDPRGRALRLDRLDTYLYYLRKLGNEHLSFILLLVLATLLVVIAVTYVRRQRGGLSAGRALHLVKPEAWTVLAWAVGSYVLLTLSIYHETRAIIPALPAIALILGAAVLKLPWRRLRLAVLALLLSFAVVQFFAISYESVFRLLPRSTVQLPLWGQAALFAQGVYIQLPDEGPTDRGYWIEPDVLQRMEQRRLALAADDGRELLSLGLLVDTSQINAGPFTYLILTEYPHLRVESLIDSSVDSSAYRQLFAYDYVAVKRVSENVSPAQEELIQAILDRPPRLFDQVFELETTYLLPDGDTVYLYRQREPLPADYPVEYITRLAESLGERTRGSDAILLTPLQLASLFVSHYAGPADIYLAPATADELAAIASQHDRVFLVLGDPAAGDVQALAEEWLDRHAFPASHEWADSLQLLTYGTMAQAPAAPLTPSIEAGIRLGDSIELEGYDLPTGPWHPGDILPLTLFWLSPAAVEDDYQVFVHLVDGNDQLVAQTDSAPVGGSRPTSSWREGELIVDRHGLLIPDGVPPGEYEMRVGMYLPSTGLRLPISDIQGITAGDTYPLGRPEVTSP